MTNITGITATTSDAAIDPATGRPARTRLVAILIAIICLPVLGSVLIAPVLPQMAREFRAVPGVAALVPLVLTIPSLAIAIGSPIAGSIADRIGRRRLLLVGLVAYAILGTAPLYLPDLGGIILSRVLVGVAEALVFTTATALTTDYFSGQRRNRYLALSNLVTSLAGAVFLVIGGVLGQGGWRTPFVLYGVSLLIAIPVFTSIWEPGTARPAGARRVRPSRIPPRFLVLQCIIGFLVGILYFSIVVQMPFIYDGLGVKDTGTIGVFSGLASLATAAGAFSFRWLNGLGLRRIIPSMLLLSAIGLALVWVAPNAGAALIGALVTSLAAGLLLPTGLTWIVAPLAADQRGRAVGLATGTLFVGQFLCPLIVLAIEGATGGSLAGALGVLAGVGVVGAVAFGIALASRPQPDLRRTSLI